jgi:hypothetical protein
MFSKSKYVKKPFSHALSKNKKRELDFSSSLVNSSDLDKIQTCNLLSRNQVRYSVAPRGRLETIK